MGRRVAVNIAAFCPTSGMGKRRELEESGRATFPRRRGRRWPSWSGARVIDLATAGDLSSCSAAGSPPEPTCFVLLLRMVLVLSSRALVTAQSRLRGVACSLRGVLLSAPDTANTSLPLRRLPANAVKV